MRYLTKSQIRTLKKIQNAGLYDCSGISNDELRTIKFLRSEGFLDANAKYAAYQTASGNVQSAETGIKSVSISEAGKAYFVELSIDRIRYRIPLFISIISILLSGIALYSSSNTQKTEITNTVTIATTSDANAK